MRIDPTFLLGWMVTASVVVAGGTRPTSAAKASGWFNRALVGMEVGPTGAQFGYSDSNDVRYCARFDGREIVRRCLAAHCDYADSASTPVTWTR